MGLTIANPVREIKKFSIFQSKVECLIKPGLPGSSATIPDGQAIWQWDGGREF